jgi:hypothetical protein
MKSNARDTNYAQPKVICSPVAKTRRRNFLHGRRAELNNTSK